MGLETHFQIFRPIGLVTQFPNPNKPKYTIPTNIWYLAIYSIFRNTNLNNRNNSDTIIHISALTICIVISYLKYFIELKFSFDSRFNFPRFPNRITPLNELNQWQILAPSTLEFQNACSKHIFECLIERQQPYWPSLGDREFRTSFSPSGSYRQYWLENQHNRDVLPCKLSRCSQPWYVENSFTVVELHELHDYLAPRHEDLNPKNSKNGRPRHEAPVPRHKTLKSRFSPDTCDPHSTCMGIPLEPKTMVIRDSMVKVEADPMLLNNQAANSLEIVGTSIAPKKTYLSKNLILLLSYGGVPDDFFLSKVEDALDIADGAFTDKSSAFKVSISYGGIDDDSTLARMIECGIPLEEPYLQCRLSILMKEEKKALRGGRILVPDSYYLMGTADPTGKLEKDEVCVILDSGQVSGKVLVYRNPGLHFGDVHVLKATYVVELESFVGNAKYAIFFPCKGPRSIADEIGTGDFDGDMYWVSRNSQLLEHFKPSEPWSPPPPPSTPKVPTKSPKEFLDRDPEELEDELFRLFLTTRFQPSFTIGEAADCWMALMDWFLTLGDDNISEKDCVRDNIVKLINIYYDALDAPKRGGPKIEVPKELKVEKFPHYMEKKNSYTSKSILGAIYDRVGNYQSEDHTIGRIWKLPCFDIEVPEPCYRKWKDYYGQYREEMSVAMDDDGKERRNEKADEIIREYKKRLYGVSGELEESERNMEEILNEALAIYNVTYDYAMTKNSVNFCGFAWKVAGSALFKLYISQQREEKPLQCLPSVLREIF
ncbi:hypothetical protein UlMin_022169 [Ulmus minor]